MTRAEALEELDRVIWDPNHEDRVARYDKLKKALRGGGSGPQPGSTKTIQFQGEISRMEMMRENGMKYAMLNLREQMIKQIARKVADSPALQVVESPSYNTDAVCVTMRLMVVIP